MNKSKDILRGIWDTIKWINISIIGDLDREKKETESLLKKITFEHF